MLITHIVMTLFKRTLSPKMYKLLLPKSCELKRITMFEVLLVWCTPYVVLVLLFLMTLIMMIFFIGEDDDRDFVDEDDHDFVDDDDNDFVDDDDED